MSINPAAWSEKRNTEANNKFEHLRQEIVKHIKSEKHDAKIEKSAETMTDSKVLKSKLASQIIKESGIAKQNKTLTGMTLASFEEKYKEAGVPKTKKKMKSIPSWIYFLPDTYLQVLPIPIAGYRLKNWKSI